MGVVENYLDTCVHKKVDIEALERLMEPENDEVSLRYVLEYSTRGGSDIFQHFDTAEKRTTSCQAEDDGWRVRVRRQQARKLEK